MCIGLYHDWIYLSVDMDFVQSRIHIISCVSLLPLGKTAFILVSVVPCLFINYFFVQNKTQKVLVCELFFVFLN